MIIKKDPLSVPKTTNSFLINGTGSYMDSDIDDYFILCIMCVIVW